LKTTTLNSFKDIEQITLKSNEFADCIGSNLAFHRIQMPLLWWKHFSSQDDVDFGTKRGRNVLGYKLWVRNPAFIIVENQGRLLGIAPLFVSQVLIERGHEPLQILSFCPDSVLFFYQDFLVHADYRADVISDIFREIDRLISSNDMMLFLGHIPEDSENIALIRKEIERRRREGWIGTEAKNFSRGGIFPWNVPSLTKELQRLEKELPKQSEAAIKARSLLADLDAQTSALMMFPATRKKLEMKVDEILRVTKGVNGAEDLARHVTASIASKPILYPYMKTQKDIDSFYSSLSASRRYYYSRYMKKFVDSGGVFENIPPENITALEVREYLDLHMARWGNESAAVNKNTLIFHEEAALAMAEKGYFRLFFAKHDNKRIAALACFDIGKKREFYYSGRTTSDDSLRAGKLIVLFSILDAIERKIPIYDFGYGGDKYKFDFTSDLITLRSFFLREGKELPDMEKLFPMYEYPMRL